MVGRKGGEATVPRVRADQSARGPDEDTAGGCRRGSRQEGGGILTGAYVCVCELGALVREEAAQSANLTQIGEL